MPTEKRQITRNRTSHSCQTCRRRKVKCGKERPICGSCEKTGEECIYDDEEKAHGTIAAVSQHQDASSTKKRKKDEGEFVDHSRSNDHHHLRSLDISAIESQVAELTMTLKELHGWSLPQDFDFGKSALPKYSSESRGVDKGATNGIEILTPCSTHTCAPTTQNNLQQGQGTATPPESVHDSCSNTGTQPSSDLTTILQKLSNLNQTLRASVAKTSRSAVGNGSSSQIPRSQAGPAHLMYQHGQQEHLSPIVNMTPGDELVSLVRDEEQSNVLFRIWLTNVYPILPIVDPILAFHKYMAFHKWYRHDMDRGVPDPVADTRPLIVAIYYAGTVSISRRGHRRWFPEVSRRLMLAAMRWYFTKSLEQNRPYSLETIAAMVMMQHMCPEWLDSVQAGVRLNTIIRSAQSWALHRRPLPHLRSVEKGIRRRLWMEIVHLDASLATSRGLPPMLSDRYFESSLPSDFKDYQAGDQDYDSYETTTELPDNPLDYQRDSRISVHNLVARARALMAMTTSSLNAIIMGTKPIVRDELAAMRQILNTFELHTRAIINRIPAEGTPELEIVPVLNQTGQSLAMDYGAVMGESVDLIEVEYMVGQDPAIRSSHMPFIQDSRSATKCFHHWARVSLSMAIDQMHCLTYRPFLRSKLWKMARQCALKHCHSFMRKYISLATNIELERFRWAAMPMPQPMHATAIMLTDLYEHPISPEAARSRALIDQMLSLSKPVYGLVGESSGLTFLGPLEEVDSEARELFGHLRSKAWQVAGLDPSCLWTEEEQIEVGAAVPPTEFEKLVQHFREDNLPSLYNGTCIPLASIIQLKEHELQTMNGELRHPMDAGIPPDSVEDSVGPTKLAQKAVEPNRGLSRAHAGQEPVPPYATKASADLWHSLPQHGGRPFGGMNELIEKIRKSHLPPDDTDATDAFVENTSIKRKGNEPEVLYTNAKSTASAATLRDYPYHEPPARGESNAAYESLSYASNAGQQAEMDSSGHETMYGVIATAASSLDFDWDHWDWVFGQADENTLHPAGDIDRDVLTQIFASEE